MLRDGKETLFFSKVSLSTEILGLKTAHFTGQKTKQNKTKQEKKKKKKQRNKREKKLSAPIRQLFPRRPHFRKSRLTNLIIITQFTSFVAKY